LQCNEIHERVQEIQRNIWWESDLPCVPCVDFVCMLVAREVDFLHVDDHHNIPVVHIGGERWLVFALQDF
jgi:hypothetical protein